MTLVEERLYGLAEILRSSHDPQHATTLADFVASGEPVVGLEILSDQLTNCSTTRSGLRPQSSRRSSN
jgi:hypothetical protein